MADEIYNLPIDQRQLTEEDVRAIVASMMGTPTSKIVMAGGGFEQSSTYVSGVAGWRIDALGNAEFNNGVFRGSLVAASIDIPNTTTANSFHVDSSGNAWWGATTLGAATAKILNTGAATFSSGSIGGFDLGADYIRDAANSMGLASTVTGGDDVRFWAGSTFANRATAPARVTESGVATFTSGTIGGWTLGATTLTATNIVLDSGNKQITVGTGGNQVTLDGTTGTISSNGNTWTVKGDGTITGFGIYSVNADESITTYNSFIIPMPRSATNADNPPWTFTGVIASYGIGGIITSGGGGGSNGHAPIGAGNQLGDMDFTNTKIIRIKQVFQIIGGAGTKFGWGLGDNTGNFYDRTDVTSNSIKFICDNGVLYAVTSNGAAVTATNITGSLTLTIKNVFEIVWTPGVNVKFYVNGTLLRTETATIPTTTAKAKIRYSEESAGSNQYFLSDGVLSEQI